MTRALGQAVGETADVRLGGRWTRRQAVKNGLIRWAVTGALRAADRLPARLVRALGRALGRATRALSPELGRAAARAATRCLPAGEAAAVARASFECAGENLATCLLLRRPEVRALDWVEVPEADRVTFARALGRGRGVVFVSAHHGPFELVAAAMAELGHRPAIVVRESYDPGLDPLVDAHRIGRGIEVIHRGGKGAALRIVRALRAGRPVGFLPDLGGRVPAAPATFLGRVVPFPVGPQRIALRTGASLIVGVLHAAPKGTSGRPFRLSMRDVSTDAPLSDLTPRVAQALERAILDDRASVAHFPWMALGTS